MGLKARVARVASLLLLLKGGRRRSIGVVGILSRTATASALGAFIRSVTVVVIVGLLAAATTAAIRC